MLKNISEQNKKIFGGNYYNSQQLISRWGLADPAVRHRNCSRVEK